MRQELRQAFRTVWRYPAFALLAIVTLALGVGANTAVFSIVHGILFRALPFPEPERLVVLNNSFPLMALPRASTSVPDFYDYRAQKQVFEEIASFRNESYNLTGVSRPERVLGMSITPTAFPMLGLKPLIGRVITEEDSKEGAPKVALLDEGCWRARFAADAKVLGRTIRLNDEPYEVVGVIPEAFGFLTRVEVFVAHQWTAQAKDPQRRGNQYLMTIGRLRNGLGVEQARREIKPLEARLQKEFPDNYPPSTGWHIMMTPLMEMLVGDFKTALLVLIGAVGLVLLIACANVANLLLARGLARSREVSVRAALGASRWRLARQMLLEGGVLGVLGGLAGLVLGAILLRLLLSILPENLPRVRDIRLDLPVLAYTMAAAVATAFLFSLAPLVRLFRTDLHDSLKEGGRSAMGSLKHHKLRGALVVAEVALSLMLLAGAGLLMRSFARLQEIDPGFRAGNVLSLRVNLPGASYRNAQETAQAYGRMTAELRGIPGVTSVGGVQQLPFGQGNSSGSFDIEGLTVPAGGSSPHADQRMATPGYFETLSIPLKRGRYLTESDRVDGPLVAVVDEKLAKQYWPDSDPIGKRVRRGSGEQWMEIVGIVGHVRHSKLEEDSKGAMYVSALQRRVNTLAFVVRAGYDANDLSGQAAAVMARAYPDVPLFEVKTMEQRILDSLLPRRLAMYMMGVFAIVAMCLAGVGLYGVLSQAVAQRTQEIGVRMALGAERSNILKLVLTQALVLAVIGLAIGSAAALAATRSMTKLLYGVSPNDPATLVLVSAILLAVAAFAAVAPAWRATRVDPLVALRYE